MQETNRIEFKREVSDRFERTVLSFLNYAGGGEILVGVDDNGVAVGIEDVYDRSIFELTPSFTVVTFPFAEALITQNDGASIVENIVENTKVNAVQAKILKLMRNNSRISTKDIATEIGIAPRNVQVHIQTLKNIGLVKRMGAAKGGYWVVKLPNPKKEKR